jgi:uncharacterized membrane protein
MRGIKIAHVVYTFGTALFAGLLYAFEQGVIPTLNQLSGPEYVKVEQLLIRALDGRPVSVIVVATASMLLPLYPLIALRRERTTPFWRWTLVGWILFCFGVSVYTIVLNVPINNAVLEMDAAHPPETWVAMRDRWNLLNMIRTPINYLSLIAYLIAGLNGVPQRKG